MYNLFVRMCVRMCPRNWGKKIVYPLPWRQPINDSLTNAPEKHTSRFA